MAEAHSIHVDEFLPHPPQRVWQALTDPAKLAVWLMPNDFRPVVGHRFTFRTHPIAASGFDGVVSCEVLDIDAPRLLRISWSGGPKMATTVTWRLQPEGRGTRLFLDHEGFDPEDPMQVFAHKTMGAGWRSGVMRGLRALLDASGAA
jgi:uncharacterized protein YndB with AHSA1/START domain